MLFATCNDTVRFTDCTINLKVLPITYERYG